MRQYDRIASELREHAEALATLIVDWYVEIGEAEAWLTLPPELDQDHLPELIRALVEATLESDFAEPVCRRLLDVASRHGEHRRRDGFQENLVFTEYHLLRRAMWEQMERRFGDRKRTFDATIRIDEGIGIATTGSLYGFHRPELEEGGRWPHVLDELLEGWPGHGRER